MGKTSDYPSIQIEEYSTGGALTGQELFPFILVAVTTAFLSEMGKDLWKLTREQIVKRVAEVECKSGFNFSRSGRKVSSVFFPTTQADTTIIYYVHTEKGKVDLNFDNELLKEAEAEIVLLNHSGKLGGTYLGIDLKNLGKGGYLWPFNEIPSRANKDNFSMLADLEEPIQEKIKFTSHVQAAVFFVEMEKYEIAIKHCQIAAKMKPQEIAPCVLLVQIYDKLGDADRAIHELKKAAGLDKMNPDYHYLMADLYAWKKDLRNTTAELQKAIDLGYSNANSVIHEPNFQPFLTDPKIKTLIAKMKSNAGPSVRMDVF